MVGREAMATPTTPTDGERVGGVRGVVAAAQTKQRNLSLLKRMVDDDDDDSSSSSDNDEPPATGNSATNRSLRETRTSEVDGKTTKKKVIDKMAKPPVVEEDAHGAATTTTTIKTKKKTTETVAARAMVRSERLQVRAAIEQSTSETAEVVTPRENAKKAKTKMEAREKEIGEAKPLARKRRRVSSTDATAHDVVETKSETVENDEVVKPKRLAKKNTVEDRGTEDTATAKRLMSHNSRELKADGGGDTSKPKRLTRQNSRDALKISQAVEPETLVETRKEIHSREENKVVVGDQETSNGVSMSAQVAPGIKLGSDTHNNRTGRSKSVESSDASKVSRKSRILKRSRDNTEAADAVTAEDPAGIADEPEKRSKRRSKVISDDSDGGEAEPQAKMVPERNERSHKTHQAEDRSSNKDDSSEAHAVKRRRLKRPLSASSANGSKSPSLATLLDRESSGRVKTGGGRSPRRNESKGGADSVDGKFDKQSRLGDEEQHRIKREKRKEANSLDRVSERRTDRVRENAKTLNHRLLKGTNDHLKRRVKRGNGTPDLVTVDDYIRQDKLKHHKKLRHETESSRSTNHSEDTLRAEDHNHGSGAEKSDAGMHIESQIEKPTASDSSDQAYKTIDADNEASRTKCNEQRVEITPKKDDVNGEDPLSIQEKSHSPIAKSQSQKSADEEEEGEASEPDESTREKESDKHDTNIALSSGVDGDQTDPLSFVIPKKRPAAVPASLPPAKSAPKIVQPVRQTASTQVHTPGPSPSPVSSVEVHGTVATGARKPRSKNAVPPKMSPVSQQERDFFRLAEKSNSLLKAASVTKLRTSSAAHPKLVSAFGCTADRYGAMLDSGQIYVESTSRMACPTRKDIKNAGHSSAFFGVAMGAPPDQGLSEGGCSQPTDGVPCYETLDFVRAQDRDWYQKRMYGTTFVPQLLRERVTLVMRNARYVRKSTGLLFNGQRDKEEYAAQVAERYTVNRSVPRCDILPKNWQQLVQGRATFVFLHYMNREDALIARAQFKDDEGQPLIIKGESRANEPIASNGVRSAMSPGLSPPPLSSPQQHRRSRSRSTSPSRRSNLPDPRERDMGRDRPSSQWHDGRGPRPPRERSRDRRRGRRDRRPSLNGPDARNGSRYGPGGASRSPPRQTSRSRSPQRPALESSASQHNTSHNRQEGEEPDRMSNTEGSSQTSQVMSQDINATPAGAKTGEQIPVNESGGSRHQFGDPSVGQQRRPRSRSRSRPRFLDHNQRPYAPSGRLGPEDRPHDYARRGSGDHHGRDWDARHGQSLSPPLQGRDREWHHRAHHQYDDRNQLRYGDQDQHRHGHPRHDDRGPPPRDHDRRAPHESDPYRHHRHHDGRRHR